MKLAEVMKKLKLVSSQAESVKDRFKRAREEATHAFCNEALSIQERIFAAKLRVVSEILQCLESPDTAVTSCVLFLGKLHDLPSVREIFSIYLGRGVKSMVGKAARVEIVKSIMMINCVLYQFVLKFSTKYYSALAWPTITISDRDFNPISSWLEVSTRSSWGDELTQRPNEIRVDEEISSFIAAVNSQGKIVKACLDDNCIKLISTSGESRSVSPFSAQNGEDKEGSVVKNRIVGLAVDDENNVCIVLHLTICQKFHIKDSRALLYIFDEECKIVKHKSNLDFLPNDVHLRVSLAITRNKDIVMSRGLTLYVCGNAGQLKYAFKSKCPPDFIDVSDNNEIIIASRVENAVEIYTKEGDLKTVIKLPADDLISGMTFHFVLSKIMVLSQLFRERSYFLHGYSQTGEHHSSTFLGKWNETESCFSRIVSHPKGPTAFVTPAFILYL